MNKKLKLKRKQFIQEIIDDIRNVPEYSSFYTHVYNKIAALEIIRLFIKKLINAFIDLTYDSISSRTFDFHKVVKNGLLLYWNVSYYSFFP